jgi:undecaprenyl diphosphate synthase
MDALPSSAGVEPPVHVAIIMDGNGRWAKARGLPRIAGHQRGAEAVRRVVSGAAELGISYLKLYGFSSENWKRPPAEVDDLMQLLRLYLEREIATLHDNGIRLRIIGERERFNPSIKALIDEAERLTAGNRRLNLIMALSYGGRAEIAAAARQIAREAASGRLDPEALDEAVFARHLATADIPDPDLVIRTSGEKRVSNFLLWQSAYAELVFADTLWPDFGEDALRSALDEYARRGRRFGGR